MKKNVRISIFVISIFILLVASAFVFTGCSSTKSVTSTKEDVSYLRFTSFSAYGLVDVTIDDNVNIVASVNNSRGSAFKNKYIYAILPGSHKVSVFYNGELVFEQKIFVSSQETKIIELP